jgi:hypothetical protein
VDEDLEEDGFWDILGPKGSYADSTYWQRYELHDGTSLPLTQVHVQEQAHLQVHLHGFVQAHVQVQVQVQARTQPQPQFRPQLQRPLLFCYRLSLSFSLLVLMLSAARLFHCSTATGQLTITEVFQFSQADFVDEDVFWVDAYTDLYVWLGKVRRARLTLSALCNCVTVTVTVTATATVRALATTAHVLPQRAPANLKYLSLQWAEKYAQAASEIRDKDVQVHEVLSGAEPQEFKARAATIYMLPIVALAVTLLLPALSL